MSTICMKVGLYLLLIFLVISANLGCIGSKDHVSLALTIPSIKFNEKAIYTTHIYDEEINETLKVNGYKEMNDRFGIRHNSIEIEYDGNRPEGNTRIYIDGTTGTIIQSNNTTSKNGEIVGQILYPTKDEVLLASWTSFPALTTIARLSALRETELLQNHEVRLIWYGVNINYTLLSQENLQYIIVAQYHLTNVMDGSTIDIKEKYWMSQQTLFPLRVCTTMSGIVNSASITITTTTSRIYYTQDTTKTTKISCVCSADHNITSHPLVELQKFEKYPSDGRNCELALLLSSAISEACIRSNGFNDYLEKYPESYLWHGEYGVEEHSAEGVSLKKNVSWNLTFVDPDTKNIYSIIVYKEIFIDNPYLSIISIKDNGGGITDTTPIQKEGFYSATLQSIINIAKNTSSMMAEVMGVNWNAIASSPDLWTIRVYYVERWGTTPLDQQLYNTFVLLSVTSGALIGWEEAEGVFGGN